MRKYSIDTILRVRLAHQPGKLAQLATAIAREGGLLGEITTVGIGETATMRDITVEAEDEAHTDQILGAIRALDGVELLQVTDRVFERHRGGKLHSTSRVELRQIADLRYIYTPGVARVATAIHGEPERAWDLTGLGNSVGIFTNGRIGSSNALFGHSAG